MSASFKKVTHCGDNLKTSWKLWIFGGEFLNSLEVFVYVGKYIKCPGAGWKSFKNCFPKNYNAIFHSFDKLADLSTAHKSVSGSRVHQLIRTSVETSEARRKEMVRRAYRDSDYNFSWGKDAYRIPDSLIGR